MQFNSQIQTKNQQVILSSLKDKKIQLFLKREDQIHPFVSGNKFRKLKYNFEEAKHQGKETIVTFGGAFSNHILATAVAGNLNDFKTIGIIRGEELGKNLEKTLAENATLKEAHKNGMQFLFVTREAYRHKSDKTFYTKLKKLFGNFYLIPEGGTNNLAIKGCKEILTKNDTSFDYICCAVGTGGTISGLISAACKHQKIIGFPALKNDSLVKEITTFVQQKRNWSFQKDYHFGGYGKINLKLITFINQFNEETGILLDPIYTGKMLFGLVDLIKRNKFSANSKILAIHTGGVQGIAGINRKLKKKQQQTILVE